MILAGSKCVAYGGEEEDMRLRYVWEVELTGLINGGEGKRNQEDSELSF